MTGTLDRLRRLGGGLPDHEVVRLGETATGRSRGELLRDPSMSAAEEARFERLVRRRLEGEPLQYLEGTVAFGPLGLLADPRALIPRPETEQLWDLVVQRVDAPPRVVVDLCTGSGNLALACKWAWPAATVYATDLSTDAVALARENSVGTGLAVTVLEGDLFGPLPADLAGTVDVLVANPPYLAEAELATLPPEVRNHEPHAALVAGPMGTEILARIAAEAPRWLRPGALVACEISEFHPREAARLFVSYDAVVEQDLTGRPRFVIGTSPGN